MKQPTKNCIQCKKLFEKKITCSKKEWVKTKFCSRDCANIGRIYVKERYKFPKGIPAWNKGKKGLCLNTGRTHFKKGVSASPKTQFGNIPAWNKGKTAKEDPRILSGERNNKWKGGVTPENHKIRTSSEYKEWRTKVFQRDNYTCQGCGVKGGWHKE